MKVDLNTKILLVEDASTMRRMEIRILNQLGFKNIVEASDGNEALEKLEKDKEIKVVISDWAMPNMDGYELLIKIRGKSEYREIPFIMATGHGDKSSTEKVLGAGANCVITKPFSPDELKLKINEAFGYKHESVQKTGEEPETDRHGRVKLKIAHIQITDHLTLGVMKHMIKTGQKTLKLANIETICMSGWNPVQNAIEDGSIDAAFILAPLAMDLFNYNVPIKLVMFCHKNGSIFVRSRSESYRKPYEMFFKHKTIFIPHKLSVHNMLAHMYLTHMGLKPGSAGKEAVNVLFDVVSPIAMPAFLKENSDSRGFIVAEPIGSKAISAGIAEKQLLSSEIWDDHPCCVVVFRDEFIEKYPEVVQEFSGMLMDAGQFIEKNPDESSKIAVDFLDPYKKLGLAEDLLKKVLTDPMGIRTDNLFPDISQLDKMQQYMSKKMGVGGIADLESFVDLRFAEQALKEDPSRKSNREEGEKQRRAGVHIDKFNDFDLKKSSALKTGKYLTFGLAEERYGVGILDVKEVVGMSDIRALPRMPDFIKGVINLREKVIPIIEIRQKFGMGSVAYTDRTCIIIVEVSALKGSTYMGIVVDKIFDVAVVAESELQDTPDFGPSVNIDYIIGIAKKKDFVIILLDIDQILNEKEKSGMAMAS